MEVTTTVCEEQINDLERTESIIISNNNAEFQVTQLIEALSICLPRDNNTPLITDIYISDYIAIYREVVKIFYSFGSLFYFVVNEINEKLLVLERHLAKDPDHYSTLESMLKFEIDAKMLYPSKLYHRRNATRTMIQLHRSIFIFN